MKIIKLIYLSILIELSFIHINLMIYSSYFRKRVHSSTPRHLSPHTFPLSILVLTLYSTCCPAIFFPYLVWVFRRRFLETGTCLGTLRFLWLILFYYITLILDSFCSHVVIIVVPIEESLNTISPQKKRVLSHLFLIVVLPLTVCILGIKIVFFWRYERRN